jgi:predicted signal transduction protein with EAL and GGDEF domain
VDGGRKNIAEDFAARILTILNQPYHIHGQKLDATASIGTSLAPEHGQDPDVLLKRADTALYFAKTHGRGVAVLYQPGTTEACSSFSNPLKAELPQVATREELVLHYQPIIDLRKRKVCGFEALMRWKHPTRGMIPPDHFIPLAEESGEILSMGAWALRQACADAQAWPQGINVSVNLSPAQLETGDFSRIVAEALNVTGLAAHRLQLEITETSLMRDGQRVQKMLRNLQALGVTIALDDFGSSFATFNYLRTFPFEKIKIDRSFVHGAPDREDCHTILRSMADLASELGIQSVAEGVETASDLASAIDAGCDEAQGFFFSLPVPARALTRALTQCDAKLDRCALARSPDRTAA